MKIQLRNLLIRTRQSTRGISFSNSVTFLYGPPGSGTSTVARLVDYCLGGDVQRAPAIQQDLVSAELGVTLGDRECVFERGACDSRSVRVTWSSSSGGSESVLAPLSRGPSSFVAPDVHNLSDLVFHLCGVSPIRVRQRTRDPHSSLGRLSIRDVLRYCYLEPTRIDSSFFGLEHPCQGPKGEAAMPFFTGLHSERLSHLEEVYEKTLDEQRGKREAVLEIRALMQQFDLGSESEVVAQLAQVHRESAEVDLQEELARHESTSVDAIRAVERQRETLEERVKLLRQLQQLSQAIDNLEQQAGALQDRITHLRFSMVDERARLRGADANIAALTAEFRRVMLSVGFPGFCEGDRIVIDPRNWWPTVLHGRQEWNFWDTGSAANKTLFKVCYALALHTVALRRAMPVPSLLMIDNATKDISDDGNPEAAGRLYDEVYRVARGSAGTAVQCLLIDSDLVAPVEHIADFMARPLTGEHGFPGLVSHYLERADI